MTVIHTVGILASVKSPLDVIVVIKEGNYSPKLKYNSPNFIEDVLITL